MKKFDHCNESIVYNLNAFFFCKFFYYSKIYICSPTGFTVISVTFTLFGSDNKNITTFEISLDFKAGITVEILKSVGRNPAAPKKSVSTIPGLTLCCCK